MLAIYLSFKKKRKNIQPNNRLDKSDPKHINNFSPIFYLLNDLLVALITSAPPYPYKLLRQAPTPHRPRSHVTFPNPIFHYFRHLHLLSPRLGLLRLVHFLHHIHRAVPHNQMPGLHRLCQLLRQPLALLQVLQKNFRVTHPPRQRQVHVRLSSPWRLRLWYTLLSICLGLLSNMNYHNNDALSRMSGLSSRFMLNMPITGLLLRLWGVQAVNPQNLKKLMSQNRNIGLLPGGFQEATLTTADELRIFIQSRKGFIKYALKFNYTLYPTLVLNQHQVFWTFDHFLRLRMTINKIKMPGVLFFSKKSLFFYPSDIEFITVVGKGLKGREYGEGQEPTSEEIQDMHKKYIAEVKRMYEKHREKNGNKPLVMF